MIIPNLFAQLKIVIVAEGAQNLPTNIHLELADNYSLKGLKRLKCYAFDRHCLVKIFALRNEHLFKSRYVLAL